MTTTHAAMGLLVAIGVARVDPGVATPVALAAYAGSVAPDLDVFVGQHRHTLHYPVWYWVVTVPAVGIAVIAPSVPTVAAAAFLGCAALHSSTDVLGGGLGVKPWIEDDERGVYSHYHGRWLPPLRYVRWDGAPEDLVFAVALSAPALLYFDGVVWTVVVAGLGASVVYTVTRKRLPDLVPGLFT
mgnify:CR=1 FL=1